MRYKNKSLIFGEGFNSGASTSHVDGTMLKEYQLWYHILERSYCPKYHARKPTYSNCTVSANFKDFAYFKNWCQHQKGFNIKGFSLDKDLLVKGNKVYSEDTCVFLPIEVNNALTKRKSLRGDYVIGVSFCKIKHLFKSRIRKDKVRFELGSFETEYEAFQAYKIAKEKHLEDLATRYKSQIDVKAYNALLNYSVEIAD